MNTINERIKHFRKANGYTQAEMALKLDISQSAYQQIESGSGDSMRVKTLRKFCETFSISADYMLGLSDTITLTKPQESQTAVMITAEVLNHEITHFVGKRHQEDAEGFYEVKL